MPMLLGVRLPLDARVADLKKGVEKYTGITQSEMVVADVFQGKYISKLMPDSSATVALNSEHVFVFEVEGQSQFLLQQREKILQQTQEQDMVKYFI